MPIRLGTRHVGADLARPNHPYFLVYEPLPTHPRFCASQPPAIVPSSWPGIWAERANITQGSPRRGEWHWPPVSSPTRIRALKWAAEHIDVVERHTARPPMIFRRAAALDQRPPSPLVAERITGPRNRRYA